MTLKEYLEKQIKHWSKTKHEAKFDSDTYWRADGFLMAYTDLILTCPNSILDKKILDEVW
jgi:hypothetical protein